MKHVLLLICLPLFLLSAPVRAEYPPVTVPVSLQQVAEHSYYVKGLPGAAFEHEGFISNAGVVVTHNGVVIIDALGSPSLAYALLAEVRKVTDKPITQVIVTHYHADHVLGLQVFKELGAEIIAPSGAEKYLTSATAQERLEERRLSLDPWVNDETQLVWPDRYVDRAMELVLGGMTFRMTVIGDAHSDADMSIYVVDDRVLYSGDVIFEGRVPFLGSANTRLWLQALDEMNSSELVALVPGHGPYQAAPVQAVGLTHRYLTYLREQMAMAVESFIPFEEAFEQTDWSEFSELPAYEAAHRRNAYQVYLSLERELLEE